MNESQSWRIQLSGCYFYEKFLVCSFAFIFVILSFDCKFQNLPLSGYGIIFLCLLITVLTSIGVCHAFNRLNAPQNGSVKCDEHWLAHKIKEKEKTYFELLNNIVVSSLIYPTSLSEQIRLLLKDIEREYVKSWFVEVSTNPSFLHDCHLVLEEIFFKISEKLKLADYKLLSKNVLSIYLNHLQEYKRSLRRAKKCNDNVEPADKLFRFAHPASSCDKALNHYLSKLIIILVREYAPHDLVSSLQISILNHILARKLLKTLLVNIEDPAWIFVRILYLVDQTRYNDIIKGCSYSIKEITEPEPFTENPIKYRMKSTLFTRKSELENNIFNRTIGSKNLLGSHASVNGERNAMTLPLVSGKQETNITSVLGNLISSTAAPLLPDNVSLCYQPLNKMWLSPVSELKQEIADSVVNPILKSITEGFKSDEKRGNGVKDKFLASRSKALVRSKSSDSVAEPETNIPKRDVSVGEELSECALLSEDTGRRLVKTHSFDAGSSGELPQEPGDVSPVYEEPEDFATTIAKLRSVLQQRESTSTLSDKSVQSLDAQDLIVKEGSFEYGDKFQSLDEGNSPESQVACDLPSDKRPFVNISIPTTEIKESSSSCYVLYTIQYDGIYVKESEDNESQLVLQTTIVKRRFQEFLNLQTRLEESPTLRQHLKGIKGPSKWINLPFGGKSEETVSNRKPILERYLQQVCERVELAGSPAVQEFLAYGSNAADNFASNDSHSSIQKIDKFFSNKVSGVFNSIKTALPSFEPSNSVSDAKEAKEAKPIVEQTILQGFLNFGTKSENVPPLNLNFLIADASGEALTDHVRHFLSEKSDCIEDALDVLDSSDWHTDTGECHVLGAADGCVWLRFKEAVTDEDLDKYDNEAPVLNLMLDILCELLESTDCWITKEPIVRLLKVLGSRWEIELTMRLSALDWERITANLIRLLRIVLFSSQNPESINLDAVTVQKMLLAAVIENFPVAVVRIIGEENLKVAVELFLDSLRHSRYNRDAILRLCDLLLTQLLSCPHLVEKKLQHYA